jgi:hypothetical protein
MRKLTTCLFLLTLAHCGHAGAPPAANSPEPTTQQPAGTSASLAPPDAAYHALVQRARAGDETLDFKELRVAYVKSTLYQKNAKSDADQISALRKAMFQAASKRDAAALVPICDSLIDKVFIDLDAHKFLKHAHTDLGHRDLADRHRFIELGLLKSITVGNDGKSAAAAWPVVTVDEEYFVLAMLDAKLAKQSLVEIGGHSYDVMETVNTETNAKVTYYFNVDIHLRALATVLGQ